ncbi:hypothetical protein L6R53_18295 [Myxococcota bacterium]|nr:hypothetical protein [Myxococcota bacterium]
MAVAVSNAVGTGVLLGLLGQPAHLVFGVLLGGVLLVFSDRGVDIDTELLDTLLAWPALTQLLWMLPLAFVLRRAHRVLKGLAAVAALVAVANAVLWWLPPWVPA